MNGRAKKEDLRIIKTQRAITEAMRVLLEQQSFKRITIRELCEEADISRATFYAHFLDKYDLLRDWLNHLRPQFKAAIQADFSDLQLGALPVELNKKAIHNVVRDGDREVHEILLDFMESVIYDYINDQEIAGGAKSPLEQQVLVKFCAGGVVNLLYWLVQNDYAPEIQACQPNFFLMLQSIIGEHA